MSQLSRLISILTLLKSKRLLTATELSQKFNVSVRTIYRDIRKLEEAGVPVATIEGRGYSLMEGYTVAPVQFTEKQANALVTAKHLVQQTQDTSFIANFDDALTKITSVFKSTVQEKSELLSSKIYVYNPNYEDISSDALSELQVAITNFNYTEISYRKAEATENTFRKIEPYALISTQQKWILIAWCHLRNSYRAFRLDRMQHFKILEDTFKDRKFNLKTYFRSHSNDNKKNS